MLISYEQRFIFIHVAKVAGLSVREALAPYCREPPHFRIARPSATRPDGSPNPLLEAWRNRLLHARARDVQRELPTPFRDFFTFGFVRNPWDWHVSMYHFILAERDHIHHRRVAALPDFDAFIDWVVATPKPFARGATKLQSDMLTDDRGRIMVDIVGRFERLSDDFAQVCNRIGIAARLPRVNATRHRPYASYYSERSRWQVAALCRDDIERFGYRFDGAG